MQKVVTFLVASTLVFAKPLDFSDMKEINRKMFSYHVIFESYNTEIARRSLQKIYASMDPIFFYFMQFDRDKIGRDYGQMVKEYDNGSFSTYLSIRESFSYGVKKCRRLRAGIRYDILNNHIDMDVAIIAPPKKAPVSTDDQKRHIAAYMISNLRGYAEKKGKATLTMEEKKKVLDYYERKLRAHEEKFLSEDGYPLFVSKMVASSLDAHSMIYGQDEIASINSHLKSKFEGIGIFLSDGIDGAQISKCVKNGPADRSGVVMAGDRIEFINGVDVREMPFSKVKQILTVKSGESVLIHLESKRGKKKMVKLTGERIMMQKEKISVETESFLDGQIAMLRVDTFYNDFEGNAMAGDLKNVIRDLRAQKPLYGLVIDLRKNLGGFFKEAVKAISLFSAKESVVVAKFRNEQVRYSKEFDPHVSYSGPIVILTSKYSASAAEILAQSLQDVGVAIVAGDEYTYGKGSIQFQTITDAQSVHKYKVTVGKYYTISGASPQLKGVPADVLVPSEYAHLRIGERYAVHALPSGDLHKRHGQHPEIREVFTYNCTRKRTAYEVMKPKLRANSEARIAKNKNYQAFLKELHTPSRARNQSKEERRKSQYGKNDLQMTEALCIIKDMHSILQTY
ncbi:PDZ domain-containing protein [bacterium]|nr:PDZ domain-containing protein [bacterium]